MKKLNFFSFITDHISPHPMLSRTLRGGASLLRPLFAPFRPFSAASSTASSSASSSSSSAGASGAAKAPRAVGGAKKRLADSAGRIKSPLEGDRDYRASLGKPNTPVAAGIAFLPSIMFNRMRTVCLFSYHSASKLFFFLSPFLQSTRIFFFFSPHLSLPLFNFSQRL